MFYNTKISALFSFLKVFTHCAVRLESEILITDKALLSVHKQGCGNTMPDLSDLVPFHSGQVRNFYSIYSIFLFCISYWINYFKLACCLENSVDPDQLASEEAS